ncbi:hypothetical protein ACFVH6_23715 [Spirillospora sp. NPDC127200]
MTDFPRKRFGKLAQVHGMPLKGPWISTREAVALTRVRSGCLTDWERAGMISVYQHAHGKPRCYMKAEMEIVAGLSRGNKPPNLRSLRFHIKTKWDEKKAAQQDNATAATTGARRSVPADFPRTVKGRVAQVYGIPAYVDEGWMTAEFAVKLVGGRISTLHRWAMSGAVSYRQEEPNGPLRYLRRELLTVNGMRNGDATLTIRAIRIHISKKLGAGT